MKFTLSWLKEHLETTATLDEICAKLTSIGLEVESVSDFAEILKAFTVAEIISTQKHPQADKLNMCKVNTGTEILDIVCGAPNARAGIKIPLARIGTIIPANGMEIKKTKIRGVESSGMLCSADELGIAGGSEGILELPEEAVVGQPFAPFIGLDSALIEIAITPNRGDCLGVHGIARDLSASGIGTLKKPSYHDLKHEGKTENPIKISIDSKDCNWFIGVHIKDLQNKPSPDWLRKKLESIGKRSISALVDITNYLTFTYGRPAHIYDADKLNGNITIRSAVAGEKFTSLDDKEYALDENILVVADSNSSVAVAGVIGGLQSGCSLNTTNAYLELAHFSPSAVARSGRQLQIDSDARYRFERTVDISSSELLSVAIKLITDICGGTASKEFVAGNISHTPRQMEFQPQIIEAVTGIRPDIQDLDKMLTTLGFSKSGNYLNIPSWRSDISIPEDIAEEYARLNGYDNIPVTPMSKPLKPVITISPAQKKTSACRRILAGRGMNEVVTFSFMAASKAGLFTNDPLIEVANPISSELGVMRPSIVPNLLSAIVSNQVRGKNSFSFFESGSIFKRSDRFVQSRSITGIRSGVAVKKTPLSKESHFDLFSAKADTLAVLAQYFDVSKLQVEKNDRFSYYHLGRSGIYKLGQKVVAVFGEIHPAVKKQFDVRSNACAFEIFVDELPQQKPKADFSRKQYNISNFQTIERDFAFIVESSVLAQDVISAVRKSERSIANAVIETVSIFDIYEGDKLGEGKKSIAFSVRIQPSIATLTDEQIETASRNIVESVRISTGGSLRDS